MTIGWLFGVCMDNDPGYLIYYWSGPPFFKKHPRSLKTDVSMPGFQSISLHKYLSVSKNRGTPISHPKMIIFSRKTPWVCWGFTHHFWKHPYLLHSRSPFTEIGERRGFHSTVWEINSGLRIKLFVAAKEAPVYYSRKQLVRSGHNKQQ